jgi:hypothetical protein
MFSVEIQFNFEETSANASEEFVQSNAANEQSEAVQALPVLRAKEAIHA